MRYNPFNPQQPARPDFFVGREPEIVEFEKFLSQTMHGSPMNMSVTGNRGMGKTSILVKFEEIAKREGCLTLRLSNYEGNIKHIIDFADYICSNLKREIMSKSASNNNLKKLQEWISTFKPTMEWKDISLSIEKKQVVQEMFKQRLIKLWNEMKNDYKAGVILIDEAESLEKVEGVLPFLRDVFQSLSLEANYMVVLAGKLNFPERMSESFSPLNRFFPCSKLTPFKSSEIENYITKKLTTVNIKIDKSVINSISEKSEGHPYVLVAMCYLLFDSLKESEDILTNSVMERAELKISARLTQDFFAPMYHPLTPKAKEILSSILNKTRGLEFSFSQAVKWTKKERNHVSPYIQELLRKGIINKPERGKYEFFHRLFIDYVKKEINR